MAFYDPAIIFPTTSTLLPYLSDAYLNSEVDRVMAFDAMLDDLLQNSPPYLPPPNTSQNPIVIEDEPASPPDIKAILKERKKFLSLHTRINANVDRWWRSFMMASLKEQEKYCRDNWAHLDNEGTLRDLKWVAENWIDFTEARLKRLGYKAASEKDGMSDEELAKWVKEDSEKAKAELPEKLRKLREKEAGFVKEGRKIYKMERKEQREKRNGVKRDRDDEEVEEGMGSPKRSSKKKRSEEPVAPINPPSPVESPSAIETPSDEQEMDDITRLFMEEFKKNEPVISNDDEEEQDEDVDLSDLFSEEEAEEDTPGTSIHEEEEVDKDFASMLAICQEAFEKDVSPKITSREEEVEDSEDLMMELFGEDFGESEQDVFGEISGEMEGLPGNMEMWMNLKLVWSESSQCWMAGSE